LKIADAHKRFRASVNASYSTRRDGTHKYQSVRKAVWLDRLGNEVEVEIVVDTIFAAWVLVDEVHSAGATTTQTYTHIIDPFNTLVRDPQLRPSYTAITGSALANGVVFCAQGLLTAIQTQLLLYNLTPRFTPTNIIANFNNVARHRIA
jgi:hypothetical protein